MSGYDAVASIYLLHFTKLSFEVNMVEVRDKKFISFHDVLCLEEREFIEYLYQRILGRAADREGLSYYLSRLRSGTSRVELIGQVQDSAEAKRKSLDPAEFKEVKNYYRRLKTPLLGGLLRLIGFAAEYGQRFRNLREISSSISKASSETEVKLLRLENFLISIHSSLERLIKLETSLAESGSRLGALSGIETAVTQHELRLDHLDAEISRLTGAVRGRSAQQLIISPAVPDSLETVISGEAEDFLPLRGPNFPIEDNFPAGWPGSAPDEAAASKIRRYLENKYDAIFRNEEDGRSHSRNRHPYRMLKLGEKFSQYFIGSESLLKSLTVFFYTFNGKNGADVSISLYCVLSTEIEHCIGSRIYSGDEIVDCGAVHLWLNPVFSGAEGQIFRIEISILALRTAANITIALGASGEKTLSKLVGTVGLEGRLSFVVNGAPSLSAKKYFAFVSGCPGDAFRYRCVHVAQALQHIGYNVDVFQPGEESWPTLAFNYKVIVLHRVPYDGFVAEFISAAQQNGAIVIFDTDDLVFDPSVADRIDAYSEMSQGERDLYLNGLRRYAHTLSLCDFVTVSTEKLAEEVTRLWPSKNIEIIRNMVSSEMVQFAGRAMTTHFDTAHVVIAYFSGSRTHRKDFETCTEALVKILAKYGNARLLIVGHLEIPNALTDFKDRIDVIDFVRWEDLASIYARVDINLAPLEYMNPFTESKSALKFLEAALLAIPTVASDLGAFSLAINNGVDGILCNSNDSWFAGLERLMIDSELRHRMGHAAWEKVSSGSVTVLNGAAIRKQYARLFSCIPNHNFGHRPTIAFVLKAPIGKTGGGYKKIFILANYLRRHFLVKVYVEAIAHLKNMSDEAIKRYCEENFDFPRNDINVGYDIEATDLVIATNWPTAPIVNDLDNARAKIYFVQDYEPEFYLETDPLYLEAETTYSLGLSIITIGSYLKNKLTLRNSSCRSIPFSMDRSFIEAIPEQTGSAMGKKCSVLFFARPHIPRRGFKVGIEALEMLKLVYPDVEIILYGLDEPLDLPFEYRDVGQISQEDLCKIMAKTDIHLSYSLTNISTVIYEAMACGCACVEANVEPVRAMVEDGFNCLLAEATATDTFRSLSRLVESPALRTRIASNGIKHAKCLTEENMCAEFYRHIEETWMLNLSSVTLQ